MNSRVTGPWSLALAATVGVAALLRAAGLNAGLWYDEIVTFVESARLPVATILTDFPGVNTHPLYSVLAHASLAAFGETAWALRLPAAAFGTASVVMAYLLSARLMSRSEAWAGAAVLATSYHHIWFSQNARGYTMLGFFALFTTYWLVRGLESGRARDLVWYAAGAAAGAYTHATMAFVVAGQAAVILGGWTAGWRAVPRRSVRSVIGALIAAGVLAVAAYAPFVPGLVEHLQSSAPREAAQVATGGWAVAEALRNLLSGTGMAAAVAGAALAAVGAAVMARSAPVVVALFAAPVVMTAAALLVLGQPVRPRFFFSLSGAAAVFVGRGLGAVAAHVRNRVPAVATRWPQAALVAVTLVLIAASATVLPRNYAVPKQDYAGAVRYLDDAARAGVRVAATWPACVPIELYFVRPAWPCLRTIDAWRAWTAAPGRALVLVTLADYIDDPGVRDAAENSCAAVHRLPGTLSGGDIVICEPRGRRP